MTADPHGLRANVAFALDLADRLGVAVQGVNATDWGTVDIYAWDTPADRIDAIADREGWTGGARDGAGWYSRRHTFEVDGRSVRVDLTVHAPLPTDSPEPVTSGAQS